MTKKRILVTGASGCIGHYITEALINQTDHELYLLVRNPAKLQVNTKSRPGITVLQGDMGRIEDFTDLLKTIDTAVLTATVWGGEDIFDINVTKTVELINLLDPEVCQQVIYFSTASILDSHNQLLKEAGEIGTDYIRSKYECFQKLTNSAIKSKITKIFPTLVLGGDNTKPYSHLSAGIPEITKLINLIRFFKADGSFHFIHGKDVAEVVRYLIDNPPKAEESRQLVLGQKRITADGAIDEACNYLNKKIYFRVPLSLGLANILIPLFRIQMAAWDRFCLTYRHFSYDNPVNPESLGLPNYCATFSDVLQVHGVARK
ncbi:NAD-dependent epimerase/dehydratase family protein [Chlorogloea sp. CCALA 695]|uniref:NAD-dependent epimerase/dehydratase family protein n=1 Tax=Chlorogloea sp. CCALA 695 TaxID=2107693 RepID=UPI000D0727CA|nr:NAD(P)-dependent oxidoreductase [Chlorogloea sp. CCALA 695]PSB35326.1 epimerase [Chlorogloea sp. CCALA 695]